MASTGAQTGIYEIPGTFHRYSPISQRVNASPAVDGDLLYIVAMLLKEGSPQREKSCIMSKSFLQWAVCFMRRPMRPRPAPKSFYLNVDDGNEEFCGACRREGTLLCCDNCPAAYHFGCAGYGESEYSCTLKRHLSTCMHAWSC